MQYFKNSGNGKTLISLESFSLDNGFTRTGGLSVCDSSCDAEATGLSTYNSSSNVVLSESKCESYHKKAW